MIERVGDATVAYLDDDFNPVPKHAATLVKVNYDDGGMRFGRPIRRAQKYSPDQLRDDHGQFADEGGGLTPLERRLKHLSAVGEDLPSKTPYDTAAVRGARVEQTKIMSTHLVNTPEREQLRNKIADQQYGTGAATKNREAWIVLGPPGAGKSQVLANPLAAQHGALIIDSDSSKEHLPEFKGGANAGAVHEESSEITHERVLPRAVRAGDNIVLPMVGKTVGNVAATIDRLHENGYQVHLTLNEVPPTVAAQRVVERFQHNGRFVDPEYVLNQVGTKPRATYEALKSHPAVVDYTAYSNDVPRGHAPILLERASTGGRGGRKAYLARARQLATQAVAAKAQLGLPLTNLPHLGHGRVRVLVFDADGRLLLLHWWGGRARPEDWGVVQGKIADKVVGETEFEAAKRELNEETGYAGDQVTWRKLYDRCWSATLPPGAGNPTLSEEHTAYRWIPAADARVIHDREAFYGTWWRAMQKQSPADPHQAAVIVHAAQVGDWQALAQVLAGPLAESGSEGVVQALGDLGIDDPGAFRIANDLAVDFAAQRAAALVRGISDRTQSALRDLVARGLSEGWSSDELANRLNEDWAFSPERASVIARTEIANAHSAGTLQGWRATGQVAGKRNLLSNDHVGDDECDDNTAVGVIPIDASFPSGDDGPPYHPNCECVVVPELITEDDS